MLFPDYDLKGYVLFEYDYGEYPCIKVLCKPTELEPRREFRCENIWILLLHSHRGKLSKLQDRNMNFDYSEEIQ